MAPNGHRLRFLVLWATEKWVRVSEVKKGKQTEQLAPGLGHAIQARKIRDAYNFLGMCTPHFVLF